MLLDILKVVREVLADTAADVGQIAQQVEVAAELAEETIRPDAEGCPSLDNVTNEDFENALEGAGRDARGATATAASQGPEQVKAAAMIRIQKVKSLFKQVLWSLLCFAHVIGNRSGPYQLDLPFSTSKPAYFIPQICLEGNYFVEHCSRCCYCLQVFHSSNPHAHHMVG